MFPSCKLVMLKFAVYRYKVIWFEIEFRIAIYEASLSAYSTLDQHNGPSFQKPPNF